MTTTTVLTSDQLWTAIRKAAASDVILLGTANFGDFRIDNTSIPDPGVTIAAATGAVPVVNSFTGYVLSGVNLAGFDIFNQNGGSCVVMNGGERITLTAMKLHGLAARPTAGNGVTMANMGPGCRITHNEIYDLGSAIVETKTSGIVISDNLTHDLMSDGIITNGSDGTTIERNDISSHYPTPGDHPDGIQGFGDGRNLTIRDNIIRRGNGFAIDDAGAKLTGFQADGVTPASLMPMQGIFIERTTGLTITGNACHGTLYNGISLSAVATALVQNNFVQGSADMGTNIITRDASSDVTIDGNTVSQPIIQYVPSGGAINPRYSDTGTTKTVAPAALVSGVPDETALRAWLAAKGVVTPPPPPVDPNLAIIADLKARLAVATSAADGLQAQLTTAQTANTTLQGQLTTSQNNAANLLAANSTLQAQVTTLTQNNASLGTQVTSLTTQLAAAKALSSPVLQAQVTTLTAQLKAANDNLTAVKATLTSTSARLATDEAKLAQIRKDAG